MSTVFILLADGFEESEALVPADYLRRVGFDVQLVTTTGSQVVVGDHDIAVTTDVALSDVQAADAIAVIIPGGGPGAHSLRDNDAVIDLVRAVYDQDRLVASICAGPIVLERAGILEGKQATCYPGFEDQLSISERLNGVARDENVITASGPAFAAEFAFEIIRYLDESRLADLQQALLVADLASYLAGK